MENPSKNGGLVGLSAMHGVKKPIYWLLNQLLGSMSKNIFSSTSEAARVFETTTLNFRGNNSRATMTPYRSQDVNSATTSGSLVLCNLASFIKDMDTLG